MSVEGPPRVLLISQWPKVKNAEYELIERIKRTGFDIAVVDYLGFEVDSGRCLNDATLPERYDFAVSFHYDTPKFLNLPTFLWVANPLEFMHGQPTYRFRLLQHLRAYDDYAYNGSDRLRAHIRKVVGGRWRDTGLKLIGACAKSAVIAPSFHEKAPNPKIFYCGVNWEALTDRAGRAQGLLEVLQARDAADFYGPEKLLGRPTWTAFPSYRGEIPFDGTSIFTKMHEYSAVLAVSSPAPHKSRTSSGRAVEGLAAGVPVISDENPHVRHQFGDLPYYFGGADENAKADAVMAALERIRANPAEALERVREAQRRILDEYSYDTCLTRLRDAVQAKRYGGIAPAGGTVPVEAQVEVFVLPHDPYAPEAGQPAGADDQRVALRKAIQRSGADVRVTELAHEPGRRLGAKVADLIPRLQGTHAVFLTQDDLLHYDHFEKMAQWLSQRREAPGVFAAGFYVNDLSQPAPHDSGPILRNSASNSLYRWSQDSIAEHQLGALCFDRAALEAMDPEVLADFDVLAPVAMLLAVLAAGGTIERSRYVTLRARHGYYHRYLNAFERISRKGYWAQQYELLSNAQHEINALFDGFNDHPALVAIADRIAGHDLPRTPIDPAVHEVHQFIDMLRPFYRAYLKVRRAFAWRPGRAAP